MREVNKLGLEILVERMAGWKVYRRNVFEKHEGAYVDRVVCAVRNETEIRPCGSYSRGRGE